MQSSELLLAAATGLSLLAVYEIATDYRLLRRAFHTFGFQQRPKDYCICSGLSALIGNTPLVRIDSLSDATGCSILAKAEFLNPGGSVKDRVAEEIIQEAISDKKLKAPGGLITEGTVGSTGVSLALCSAAHGCHCFIAMPDDAAIEKSQLLQALGAEVERLRPVSITHPDHFVNVARRRAASRENAIFADQFENSANFRAHLKTGEEIWQQTRGIVDAFVSGAGTGGTIAGISCYLKSKNPNITVCLVDPPGSSLYNRVTRGVAFAPEESEGTRLRHPFDTVTEGIGLNRLTGNFKKAKIDVAFRGTDTEAVEMAAYLLRNEGLFVGSSAAMNCVGAVKLARHIMKKKKKKTATGGGDINNTHTPPPPPPVIVTILCDGGQRHLSKFHNAKYLESHGLTPVHTGKDLDFIK